MVSRIIIAKLGSKRNAIMYFKKKTFKEMPDISGHPVINRKY